MIQLYNKITSSLYYMINNTKNLYNYGSGITEFRIVIGSDGRRLYLNTIID